MNDTDEAALFRGDDIDDRPSWRKMLRQDVWWYPQHRDPVRIASMDRPWRYNTWQFLLRRADTMAELEARRIRMEIVGQYDDVQAFEGRRADEIERDPIHWLCQQPLIVALRRGLPTGGRALRALQARAVHWHTCPMRKKHPAPRDTCRCIRDRGKIVGATNDSETTLIGGRA